MAALLEGRIDCAIHSMKDMPSELPDGLCIAAVPVREDPRDAFLSRGPERLENLPQGAKLTTMFLDYQDDPGSTSSNGSVTLVRQPLFTGDGSDANSTIFSASLLDVSPAGSVFTVADTQVPPTTPEIAFIDNENYAYTLMANPGSLSGVAYCSVKITYEVP